MFVTRCFISNRHHSLYHNEVFKAIFEQAENCKKHSKKLMG